MIVIGYWKNQRTTRFWSSTRGQIVRCRFQKLYDGVMLKDLLVAYEISN